MDVSWRDPHWWDPTSPSWCPNKVCVHLAGVPGFLSWVSARADSCSLKRIELYRNFDCDESDDEEEQQRAEAEAVQREDVDRTLLQHLPALLAQHPAIKLQVYAVDHRDGGFRPFLTALGAFFAQPAAARALSDANLTFKRASPELVTACLTPFSAATHLTRLELRHIDEDLEDWAAPLVSCGALRELRLEGGSLEAAAAPHLARLSSLTHLLLWDTSFHYAAFAGLVGL
jgi:hypothetical protein